MEKANQKTQNEWEILMSIKQIIFGLNSKNYNQSINSLIQKFDYIHPITFNIVISQMIYFKLLTRLNDIDLYFKLLNTIETFEENNKISSKVLNIFANYLAKKRTSESSYILHKMNEYNYLKSFFDRPDFEYSKFYYNVNMSNYKETLKDDSELHKQLIKEGENPNEISKMIRNDEVEKLQEITSQTNFDFNQTIEPSLYERSTFINQKNVTLVDFAAFFGSVKCFKYLIMNGANLIDSGKFAIAGGNLEIFHLCAQNSSKFENTYEIAIEFHRNDIFKYFYENKLEKIQDLEQLGKKCITYHNYEILSFLIDEGMKINEDFISESAKIGNLFLVKYFLKDHQLPKDILFSTSESENTELVKYVLEQKEIDINTKDI